LTTREKFDNVKIGMKLNEALNILGLKDTIGKSRSEKFEVKILDATIVIDESGKNRELNELENIRNLKEADKQNSSKFSKTSIYLDIDSNFFLLLEGDTISEKFDRISHNLFLDSLLKADQQ
jgi:hypothetical protein